MASPFTIASSLVLLIWSLLTVAEAFGGVGVNYGRIADNIPTPDKVVQLLKAQGVTRVKIFDTDATVLTALSKSNMSVVVCVPNQVLSSAASDQSFANKWVQSNILHYYPSTRIEAIAVGNEVNVEQQILPHLVPAMKNIHNSLVKFRLFRIKVSSPIAYSAMGTSYPPSAGAFAPALVQPVIKPMLDFLKETSSYLMINIYPFFAYKGDPKNVPLDYALFRSNKGVVDPGSKLTYHNLLEAQIDAVYAAMNRLGHGDLKLIVTETGWPSKGDNSEIGASVANAASYNGNLVKWALTGRGTPLRPRNPVYVYLFALFNENLKPGPVSERNFGLFYPNQQKVYDISLTLRRKAGGGSSPALPKAPQGGQTWCVAIGSAPEDKLASALSYACGEGGADCAPINAGGACFEPNTLVAHASYAFNSYYQKHGHEAGSCDFGGTAHVVSQSPSHGTCQYPSGGSSTAPPKAPPQAPPTAPPKAPQGDQTWCVAIGSAPEDKLASALSYACGEGGADCAPINAGGACFEPNTLVAHASYAFNSFYQKHGHEAGSCDFGGTAQVVKQSPSHGTCQYPSGAPPTAPPKVGGQNWCVAIGSAPEDKLASALSYACGEGGVDCGPINAGGACFEPNTLVAHASYAFNSFYQKHGREAGSCDFGGTAHVVNQSPSHGQCQYPSGRSSFWEYQPETSRFVDDLTFWADEYQPEASRFFDDFTFWEDQPETTRFVDDFTP